jgi:hypothetical protein
MENRGGGSPGPTGEYDEYFESDARFILSLGRLLDGAVDGWHLRLIAAGPGINICGANGVFQALSD